MKKLSPKYQCPRFGVNKLGYLSLMCISKHESSNVREDYLVISSLTSCRGNWYLIN
uniref:Uncharacterized protein n=1 Tax=Arundo donax TaxID=35708 RepID=A0A0A9FFZ3_ARUDO